MKSSSTTSSSEAEALQTRINALERTNRETVALLESKSTSYDKLADELAAQHQKSLVLRKEVSEFEEKTQALENASMSSKFKEQALQQEVDLLKKNNTWQEAELQTRGAEFSKYRKEKGAKIAELQRANEDATETIESLRRTETVLRTRLDDVNQKAEDALSRIQQLQETSARAEESFRIELNSSQRLAELQKESADTARARLNDVQQMLEQIKDEAAAELGQMQAEVETERLAKEEAERRAAELETQIEKLESDIAALEQNKAVPATPRRGLNGFSTPIRGGSPSTFTPASVRTKGGLTMTQLYSENSDLKSELAVQKRRNQQLSETLDSFVQDLEARQPEIDELRGEQGRLTNEVTEISALLDEATKEREAANKDARRLQGQVDGQRKEANILRQQLRDLSAQLKAVLVEVQARDQGLEKMNEEQRAHFEQIVRGEVPEDSIDGASDTARLISQRLVIFRDIKQLQEQNEQLLTLTRQLGEQMEGEEARAKANQAEKDRQELAQLRDRCAQYEDEVKSLNTRSKSFIKERDMYRRMLTHRGQLPPDADMESLFGQSVNAPPRATPAPDAMSEAPSQQLKDIADYSKLLKDMQTHFDAYKQEAATDHTALKHQVDQLAKEKSSLYGEVARYNSQLTLAHERYELLNSNFSMAKAENMGLQKRTQSLSENAAKQDLRIQQAAEELVEAKAMVESMRSESSNLKADRELWKRIETRLAEDNRALIDERSRLNKIITDLQNLQNERELTDSENRRRLQNRVDSLENELSTVKRKLDEEVEEGRKTTLRREYEQDQSRTRIDDLVKSLGMVREELIAVKTQRDQLQARVDELKIDLQNAESRAQALQPRLTSRANIASAEGESRDETDAISKEQELAVEIADLRRDLGLARGEVEASKAHAEQYKAISQATEEELQNLNEANDQYREETDRLLSEKDLKIADLEQRVEEISSELATSNTELSQLRSQQDETTDRFNEQKDILEAEITRIKDECERYQETAKLHQEDLKVQAQIAQQAQQSYENELVKHAEAAKGLQIIRAEYNELKTQVAEIRADAEAARSSLTQGEESWAETKDRYEREFSEIRTRREDLNNQNKLLHDQLDSLSSQITSLKQSRSVLPAEAGESAGSPPPGGDNSQELIRYLRREKEIVDVQYELSQQELKRLRQQIEHTQVQLDQTREKLDQERRSQIDREQSAASHTKLMQTIQELNLFRESSTTLRNEARQAQSQLAEKVAEVESLVSQIQPLETKIREVENELETKEGELKLLQEDRDRWQQRTQTILQKYDRVDPAEHEAIKSKIAELEAERDQLLTEKQPLQEHIDTFPQQLEAAREELNKTWQERRDKLIEQSKNRDRDKTAKIKEITAERDQAILQRDAANSEKEMVVQQLNAAQSELSIARRDLEATQNSLTTAQLNAQVSNGAEEGQIAESTAALEAQVQAAEQKASAEAERANALESRALAAESQTAECKSQVVALQEEVETLKKKIVELEGEVVSEHKP